MHLFEEKSNELNKHEKHTDLVFGTGGINVIRTTKMRTIWQCKQL